LKQSLLELGRVLNKDLQTPVLFCRKTQSPTPEAPTEELDFIIRHASGKKLSEEEIAVAKHYARELKYPKGPWCIMSPTNMTFYTASRTTRKYLFAGRWQKT
jgi:hypothetical protein